MDQHIWFGLFPPRSLHERGGGGDMHHAFNGSPSMEVVQPYKHTYKHNEHTRSPLKYIVYPNDNISMQARSIVNNI